MRLLLVEDDPMIGESLREALRRQGFAADWVRDGKLAYNEHILGGADAARGAIDMLYRSQNTGKLLVRVD